MVPSAPAGIACWPPGLYQIGRLSRSEIAQMPDALGGPVLYTVAWRYLGWQAGQGVFRECELVGERERGARDSW